MAKKETYISVFISVAFGAVLTFIILLLCDHFRPSTVETVFATCKKATVTEVAEVVAQCNNTAPDPITLEENPAPSPVISNVQKDEEKKKSESPVARSIPFDTNNEALEDVIVETNYGRIQGFKQHEMGTELYTFLGVPFAKPPVDKLRFSKPQEVEFWSGVRPATKWPPRCLQFEGGNPAGFRYLTKASSEDCLYLNVWSTSPNNTAKLPVIVFVHGGAFTYGSSSVDEYDGKIIAALGKVVFVTLQYRLGLFGFLDSGKKDEMPGNLGMFDQALALKWVKNNIAKFGGNPDAITLFGQDVGATAVGLHMISPISKHLFHRVILQSGSPLIFNMFFDKGSLHFNKFAEIAKCVRPTKEATIKCIKEMSVAELLKTQNMLLQKTPIAFMPTITSEFLPIFPNEGFDELEDELPLQHDILVGVNSHEGTLFLHLTMQNIFTKESIPNITSMQEARELLIKSTANFDYPEQQRRMLASIYFPGNEMAPSLEITHKMSYLFGDLLVTCPTLRFAETMSAMNKTVYAYHFTERSSNSRWGKWFEVTHFDEVAFVFGLPLKYPYLYDGEEIDLSKRIIHAWAEFARTGHMPKQMNQEWPEFSDETHLLMQLNAKDATLQTIPRKRCALFNIAYAQSADPTDVI